MNFDERFELGRLLRDDGIRTFAAGDRTSAVGDGGQELLAHFFEDVVEAPGLLKSLDRLPERERQRIVDRGERAGIPYVVTGSLAGHAGFREWLSASALEPRSLNAAGAWKVILPAPNVDEQFLNLFNTGERVQAQPQEAAEPVSGPKEPGEFTRLFQTRPSPSRLPSPSQVPSPSQPLSQSQPASEKPAQQPGEFTRMFQAQSEAQPQAQSPAEPPAARPAPPKPEGPGEFTRFFEAQVHESRVERQGPLPLQPAAQAAKQGEFTKIFGLGDVKSQVAEPIEPRAPVAPQNVSPAAAGVTPAKVAAPASNPQGQGDYTRQFAAAPALTLGQTPPVTPKAPAVSTARGTSSRSVSASRLPLILGVAAVVVLVLVVVLFLAGRSR